MSDVDATELSEALGPSKTLIIISGEVTVL